ncbi:hypothetical protein [Streptomyces sp. NPDC091268]|uniref:hypothetical protein n=1 Tax=Streptomyces sp. NPDC091268 TaxID=3365979 RepID=UPI00381D6BFD
MTIEATENAFPQLTEADEELWADYHALLEAVVRQADPGPGEHGWEARERMRVGAWVRHVYQHPLSPAVFAAPLCAARAAAERVEAAELAFRMDVGRGAARRARPSADVRAVAAVAAMRAVTAAGLAQSPPSPRERVVSDVWTVVRETIAPLVERGVPVFQPARNSW